MAMIQGRIEIPARVREQIADRALAALPEECCGVLLGEREGDSGLVFEAHGVDNVSAGNRERRYEVAPGELLSMHRSARERGIEVIGFFHSHPSGDARPSRHDRRTAWFSASYLIVAVRGGEVREFRSWRLRGAEAEFGEEEILYADRTDPNDKEA